MSLSASGVTLLYLCVLQAYVDLVRAWGWRSFTIIYESNEGLVRLQELLKAHGPSEFPITVRQLGEGSDYRYVTQQL
jgi:ionotropic kainate glutamate receptor 2